MAQSNDAAPFIMALSFSFYALHDQLVEAGVLQPGKVSDGIRGFDPGPSEEARATEEIMEAIANNLDALQFTSAGTRRRFDVIEGGRDELE